MKTTTGESHLKWGKYKTVRHLGSGRQTISNSTKQAFQKLREEHPDWGQHRIAAELGVSRQTARTLFLNESRKIQAPAAKAPKDFVEPVLRLLSVRPCTPATIADAVGCPIEAFGAVVEEVAKIADIAWHGSFLALSKPSFGRIPLEFQDASGWVKLGAVADTHLACEEERLDALHSHYDLMEREGVTTVLHAGNIVDGYLERINGSSVKCVSAHDQALYVVDNYPQRKGLTTYFVTGDDHESWLMRTGANFGRLLQDAAESQGRRDLVYIGHVEADVEVKTPHGAVIVKVQHPGGGSAYARSYTGQKQVEALQGGEKPQVLLQGHYHVSNYMVERNVHVISLPGFQDQTVFARKKRLRMEVGGALINFKVNGDGGISRFQLEFNMFFNRSFYKPYLRSDRRLLKGHLVLNAKGKK